MSDAINPKTEKTQWQNFIEFHSQPRPAMLLRKEISFFRRAWNSSSDIDHFRSRIAPYGFEVVRQDNGGAYCIAANNGEYFPVSKIGISQQEAEARIGNRHIGFDHVCAEALKYGNYMKHGISPAIEGSFERLENLFSHRQMKSPMPQHQDMDDKKQATNLIRQCWQDVENTRPFFTTELDGTTFIRNLNQKRFHLARYERHGFAVVNESGQVFPLRATLQVKSHILEECLGPVMEQPIAEEVIRNLQRKASLTQVKSQTPSMCGKNIRKGKGLGM